MVLGGSRQRIHEARWVKISTQWVPTDGQRFQVRPETRWRDALDVNREGVKQQLLGRFGKKRGSQYGINKNNIIIFLHNIFFTKIKYTYIRKTMTD